MITEKKKRARLEFRATVALIDELRKVADKKGEPMSVVIRDSIRKEINTFNQFKG